MLDSVGLPGGMSMPRLRWARKDEQDPTTAAHLAVAFDTFESKVGPDDRPATVKPRPLFAYGLLSFFERYYTDQPSPSWRSIVLPSLDGEKHPSDRSHSERLARLQHVILAHLDEGAYHRLELTREVHRRAEHLLLTRRDASLRAADALHLAFGKAVRIGDQRLQHGYHVSIAAFLASGQRACKAPQIRKLRRNRFGKRHWYLPTNQTCNGTPDGLRPSRGTRDHNQMFLHGKDLLNFNKLGPQPRALSLICLPALLLIVVG